MNKLKSIRALRHHGYAHYQYIFHRQRLYEEHGSLTAAAYRHPDKPGVLLMVTNQSGYTVRVRRACPGGPHEITRRRYRAAYAAFEISLWDLRILSDLFTAYRLTRTAPEACRWWLTMLFSDAVAVEDAQS